MEGRGYYRQKELFIISPHCCSVNSLSPRERVGVREAMRNRPLFYLTSSSPDHIRGRLGFFPKGKGREEVYAGFMFEQRPENTMPLSIKQSDITAST